MSEEETRIESVDLVAPTSHIVVNISLGWSNPTETKEAKPIPVLLFDCVNHDEKTLNGDQVSWPTEAMNPDRLVSQSMFFSSTSQLIDLAKGILKTYGHTKL